LEARISNLNPKIVNHVCRFFAFSPRKCQNIGLDITSPLPSSALQIHHSPPNIILCYKTCAGANRC